MSKSKKAIKWTLISFLIIAIAMIGYYGYGILHFANKIKQPITGTGGGKTATSPEEQPPKWEGKQRVNILLLGGDSRGMKKTELPRSDSIMVASMDPITKKAYLFSILRDTYVEIPGHGKDRINTAITTGGPNLAMKTVSNLMGIPIQYYAYTDFQGFIALVDAIGGIDLDVEKDMKYTDAADDHMYDINLKKGYQHLDGKTALQYVRFRHDALSDFTRTERQRKFLTAVADKMQSTTSLIKLPMILNKIDPYIQTNMSVTDMLKLGSLAFDVKAKGIEGKQVPPPSLLEEKQIGGASVITVDKLDLKEYVEDLFMGIDPEAKDNDKSDSKSGTVSGTKTTSVKPTPIPSKTSGSAAGKTDLKNNEDDEEKDGTDAGTGTSKPANGSIPKPTSTPKPTPKPSVKPSPTPSPTPKPSSSTNPSTTPSASPKPSTNPSTNPSSSPKPSTSPDPKNEATSDPKATTKPEPKAS